MRIIYRQLQDAYTGTLCRFGVRNCCLKQIQATEKLTKANRKKHFHSGFELHLMLDGSQVYCVGGETHELKSGSYLLIFPGVPHSLMSNSSAQKYVITFDKEVESNGSCFVEKISEMAIGSILRIENEMLQKKEISETIIENQILELIVEIFRLLDIGEADSVHEKKGKSIIEKAKQYVEDNITSAPRVDELSNYCNLSTKQMTRVFRQIEGVTPGEYITNRRMDKIKQILVDTSLSLSQIAVMMNFESESYFSSFFRRHMGMPPGEYRKRNR